MRWNALLQPNFEHEATASLQPLQPLQPLQSLQPSARRWWLGWLQLLFAWVVCMLLCANIALAFAEGLPQVKQAASGTGRSGEGANTGVLMCTSGEFLPCNNRVTVDNDAGVIARRIGPFP